ncbi:MAG: hypothetical protein LBG60_17160, partial [Bifidobacteriaceae bacterium]|nr:hypothetical protein [Bifidobacteriaceae bacterium]
MKAARRLGVAAAGAMAAAGLAACAPDVIEVAPPPKPAIPPAVVQYDQVERILGQLSDALESAAESSSAEGLEGRVGGAALAMIQAQYAAAAADPEGELAFELGFDFTGSQIVARSDLWPRSFIVVTEAAELQA